MRIEVLSDQLAPLPERKTPNHEERQDAASGCTFLDVIGQTSATGSLPDEPSADNACSPGEGGQERSSCDSPKAATAPELTMKPEQNTPGSTSPAPARRAAQTGSLDSPARSAREQACKEGTAGRTAQAAASSDSAPADSASAASEDARGSIQPVAVSGEQRAHGRQIAVNENSGAECPQNAAPGQGRTSESALPFLQASDLAVEITQDRAPAPQGLGTVPHDASPASPTPAAPENKTGLRPTPDARNLAISPVPGAPTDAGSVLPTSGMPAGGVQPEARDQQSSHASQALDLSATAADDMPRHTETLIPSQGDRRVSPPARFAKAAAALPSCADLENPEGRAELPADLSDIDRPTPEFDRTGRHSADAAAIQPGTKLPRTAHQAQEPAQVDVQGRRPDHAGAARSAAATDGSGADPRNDALKSGNLLDSLNRMLTAMQQAAVETSREKTGGGAATPPEDADSDPAEATEVLRTFVPDALVRANDSMAAIHAALRPAQRSAPTTAVPGAAGTQLPGQAAAAEIKAVASLLASQSAAASREPDFLAQMAARMQMQLRDGETAVRIQLKPSILGRIEIRAETTQAGVAATILAESSSVKNYLEHNLHVLQQSFQDQGLKIDRIQVAVQEEFWPQHPFAGNQQSRSDTGQQDEAGRNTWRSHRIEKAVEDLMLDAHTLALMSPYHTFHTVA